MDRSICVNQVIIDFESGSEFLVLWSDPANDIGYWYNLKERARVPILFSIQKILKHEADGLCEIKPYIPEKESRTEENISETEKRHRDHIWSIMQELVEAEPDIYNVKSRTALLKKVAIEKGLKTNNLYAWLD